MKRIYSLGEARARFSEILRAVRERGVTITISYRGKPVAEIRPIARAVNDVERRIAELEAQGMLLTSAVAEHSLPQPIARRRGALERFLAERQS